MTVVEGVEPTATTTTTTTEAAVGIVTKTAIIIDGKGIAEEIQNEIRNEIIQLKEVYNVTPGLAVLVVGTRTDSATYVRMKKKVATSIGIYSIDIQLDEGITENELINTIHELNNNTTIHGILVQLPLPNHINESNVLKEISITKDVDGFAAINIGNLCLRGGDPPLAIPCTPAGCIELLQRYNIPISGKDCVVLGRSNIVGMPVAALLQSCNGTVTVCHSKTINIADKVRTADIIIAAIGSPQFVQGDWIIKDNVTIIDVGINTIPDSNKKSGYRLVGDVNYEQCCNKAAYITPVPGGVGPMTIAMLMKNTINLTRHSLGLPRQHLRKEQYR